MVNILARDPPTSMPSSMPSLQPTARAFEDLSSDAVIGTVFSIVGSVLVVMLFHWCRRSRGADVGPEKQRFKQRPTRTMQQVFEELIPLDLQRPKYLPLFLDKIATDHEICSLLWDPFEGHIELRVKNWLIFLGRLLSYFLVNTVLAAYYYYDGGRCERKWHRVDCMDDSTSLNFLANYCSWNDKTMMCTYSESNTSLYSIVLFSFVVLIVVVPIDKIHRHYVEYAVRYMVYRAEHSQRKVYTFEDLEAADEFDKKFENGNMESKEEEDPEIGDELQVYQSRRTTIMRAAVYSRMRTSLDYVSPEKEVELMLNFPKKYRGLNIFDDKTGKPKAPPDWKANCLSAAHFNVMSTVHYIYDVGSTKHSLWLLQHSHIFAKHLLVRQISRSRTRATELRALIRKVKRDDEKDIFMLRWFLVYHFWGYQHKVAEQILLHPQYQSWRTQKEELQYYRKKGADEDLDLTPKHIIMLVIYYMGAFICCLALNDKVDGASVNLWLSVLVIVIWQDLFFVRPFPIWFKWIWVPSLVREEMRCVRRVMSIRALSLLKRSRDLMNNVNSLLQHFHPACRAARLTPSLPSCRLLMTLSDYDLPYDQWMIHEDPEKYDMMDLPWNSPVAYDWTSAIGTNIWTSIRYCFDIFMHYFSMLTGWVLYCLLCCSPTTQFVTEELTIIVVINGLLLGIYFAYQQSELVAAGAVICLFIVLCALARWAYVADNPLLRRTKAQIREINRREKMRRRKESQVQMLPIEVPVRSISQKPRQLQEEKVALDALENGGNNCASDKTHNKDTTAIEKTEKTEKKANTSTMASLLPSPLAAKLKLNLPKQDNVKYTHGPPLHLQKQKQSAPGMNHQPFQTDNDDNDWAVVPVDQLPDIDEF